MKVYYLPNYDGINSALVAAENQAAACKIIRSSQHNFREFGGRRVDGGHLVEVAMAQPGCVFFQRIMPRNGESNPWQRQRYTRG